MNTNMTDMSMDTQDFHHPFTPYEIQLQFMQALYGCLEDGKVAVFESPTAGAGTGKSLSLICGSLTWLRDHKRQAFQETLDQAACDDDEPEWMIEFAKRDSRRTIAEKRQQFESRLAKIKQDEERLKQKQKQAQDTQERPRKKQRLEEPAAKSAPDDDEQFVLDDYDSETDERQKTSQSAGVDGLSASTLALLEKYKGQFTSQKPEQDDEDDSVKIFYCSRTHSQLSQFAGELRRVAFPSSIPSDPEAEGKDDLSLEERVKHLSLGSRKNLCINPKVQALGNSTAINERCLDLQQPGVAAEKKCSFLPSKDDEALMLEFRDHTLATVKDIEDIGKVGQQVGICPYYASRSVIKHSEIVTLPYPLLLQRSAREALNLSVKGHVVIIDEAHNLMDAIAGIHSVSVSLSQLETATTQLTTYARKFKTRLKGKNRSYLAQVIRLVGSIAGYLRGIAQTALKGGYLQESKLARKVDGYVESESTQEGQGQGQGQGSRTRDRTTVPVLFHIQSFLLPLMNPSEEGRLFYQKGQDGVLLKYMLLDPTNHFREIVEDARAVILAGGTMSPMTDYMNHLFSYVPPERLDTFSYGHVIPSKNLVAQSLTKGLLGSEFDFTYEARGSEKMITDLGRTIATLCQVIPDGVVAFFPSFDYLSQVVNVWKKPIPNGNGQTTFSLIEKKKKVMYESREAVTTTDTLLQEYTEAIESGSGALLLSVVGGKLSEGINFSDKLGRGVFIIGLPFPNIRSAVWQAKINTRDQSRRKKARATAAGKDFYENACMRAVNQCIGRAIRHVNDYAAIVMIDRRYETPRIQGKLPGWIQGSLVSAATARPAQMTVQRLSKFFAEKNNSL
ncbi:hypothetical protein N7533_000521 [Penicillium manginii]|uniref:uncharacterized protein n=1 Tax=Penicillium manginii TaxID=203109 RepID=UPI0025480969|nr:uncharacterized protein N7533_000521 [Penicillium manginii]KAJ5767938.1 hypothetical protein N7533_000521 [Penicillium manginii]